MAVTTLRINFTTRTARKNRPVEAEVFNDTVEEVAADFAGIQTQWNDELQPLLSTLPSGESGDGTDILDAFDAGLDGSTLYVDADISSDSARYYNTTRSRPNTVKEQLGALYTYTESVRDSIRSEMSTTTVAGALTSGQKTSIGDNIFDSSKTSTATSLDGLTSSNLANITQLAKDLYGSVFTLVGDGVGILGVDLQAAINATTGFTGMTNWSDSSPSYSSTSYVSNGDDLEAAIGKLDAQIYTTTSGLAAVPAANVTLTDTGGFLVATDVEAAFAEILGGSYVFDSHLGIDGVLTLNNSGMIHNGLSAHTFVEDLNDDVGVDVTVNTAGWGFVQVEDNEEYAQFSWASDATVTLIYNSTNVTNVDSDANLCIFNNGANVEIKNRLGSTKTLRAELHYSAQS